MERQFLHSESALIRKLSCLVYCAATLVATIFWAAYARVDDPFPARWVWAVFGAVPIWWIAAGVGLRLVRLVERRERQRGHQRGVVR